METDWEKHREVFFHLTFFWSSGPTSPPSFALLFTISLSGRRSSFLPGNSAVSRALQRLVRAHVRCTLLLGAGITRKSGGIVYKPQSKVFLWIFKTLKNSRSCCFFFPSVYKKKFSATKKLLVFFQKPVSVLAILYFNTFFSFQKKKSCKDSIP